MTFQEQIAVESFKGTLAFARLLIAMLFVASVVVDSGLGVIFSILCAAASYHSQHWYTQQNEYNGLIFQIIALVCGAAAYIGLIFAQH